MNKTQGNPGTAGSGAAASAQQQQQQQAARRRRAYFFCETTESILKKYEKDAPSLELHIHKTHFRFGSQESVIPKNSPLIKIFLEYVKEEQIPLAATEVFKDAGMRFYEGCIILEIVDYRGVPDKSEEVSGQGQSGQGQNGQQSQNNQNQNGQQNGQQNAQNGQNGNPETEPTVPPKSYRTLLKPTPLSIYHDLMYTTDPSHGRFTDQLALLMEAEILNLTIRNVNLWVSQDKWKQQDNKRYEQCAVDKQPKSFSSLKEANKMLHRHRPEGVVVQKPQHEDVLHQTSDIEELMLVMSDRNDDTAATGTAGKFQRLGFVEQWRKKRDLMRQQMQAQGAAGAPVPAPSIGPGPGQGQIPGQMGPGGQMQGMGPMGGPPPGQMGGQMGPGPGQMGPGPGQMGPGGPGGPQQAFNQMTPAQRAQMQQRMQQQQQQRMNGMQQGPMGMQQGPPMGMQPPGVPAIPGQGISAFGGGRPPVPQQQQQQQQHPGGPASGASTPADFGTPAASPGSVQSPGAKNRTPSASRGKVTKPRANPAAKRGKADSPRNVAGKTVPGEKTVPGKTVPGKTIPGKTVPGKTVPKRKKKD
ncbi:Transcription factor SPT20 [Yarrowia sp. C11]|nr:Transcription factor SPT20 [Yarrowia sp. C11]